MSGEFHAPELKVAGLSMSLEEHSTQRPLQSHLANMRSVRTTAGQVGRVFLRTKPSGTRQWVQHIDLYGREREIVLGEFPELSLADAKKIALENKNIIEAGGNPLARRRSEQVMVLREELDRLNNRVGRDVKKSPPSGDDIIRAKSWENEDSLAIPASSDPDLMVPAPRQAVQRTVQKLIDLTLRRGKARSDTGLDIPLVTERAALTSDGSVQSMQTVSEIVDESGQAASDMRAPSVATSAARSPTPPKQTPSGRKRAATANAPSSKADAEDDAAAALYASATGIGPNVAILVDILLQEGADTGQGSHICADLLKLALACGASDLDDACAHAVQMKEHSLHFVVERLEREAEALWAENAPDEPTIAHGNLRGRDYFC